MERFKLGKSSVLLVLYEAGVTMRGQGLSDQLDRPAELYQSGQSLKVVAAQFDGNAETVRRALRTAGIPVRKPWKRG
jgi:hypothetical protein